MQFNTCSLEDFIKPIEHYIQSMPAHTTCVGMVNETQTCSFVRYTLQHHSVAYVWELFFNQSDLLLWRRHGTMTFVMSSIAVHSVSKAELEVMRGNQLFHFLGQWMMAEDTDKFLETVRLLCALSARHEYALNTHPPIHGAVWFLLGTRASSRNCTSCPSTLSMDRLIYFWNAFVNDGEKHPHVRAMLGVIAHGYGHGILMATHLNSQDETCYGMCLSFSYGGVDVDMRDLESSIQMCSRTFDNERHFSSCVKGVYHFYVRSVVPVGNFTSAQDPCRDVRWHSNICYFLYINVAYDEGLPFPAPALDCSRPMRSPDNVASCNHAMIQLKHNVRYDSMRMSKDGVPTLSETSQRKPQVR